MPTAAEKWRAMLLLALAEMLAMAVWFSASAVVPAPWKRHRANRHSSSESTGVAIPGFPDPP